MANGWRKSIMTAIGVIVTLLVTNLYYQMSGYARADDLDEHKRECKSRQEKVDHNFEKIQDLVTELGKRVLENTIVNRETKEVLKDIRERIH